MSQKVRKTIKALLLDVRLISAGSLLLTVVFLDFLFLRSIVSELDILEHFLFGFVLSDFVSKTVNSVVVDELSAEKRRQRFSRRVDLLMRLLGFFLIGGLLWEASEWFVFPLFGFMPDPFFSLPLTLANVDGMIDVIVGAVGCFVAWCLSK